MFNSIIDNWRINREIKKINSEKLYMQAICDHDWYYAGENKEWIYNGYDSDLNVTHIAVCSECELERRDEYKSNIDTLINKSKIKRMK